MTKKGRPPLRSGYSEELDPDTANVIEIFKNHKIIIPSELTGIVQTGLVSRFVWGKQLQEKRLGINKPSQSGLPSRDHEQRKRLIQKTGDLALKLSSSLGECFGDEFVRAAFGRKLTFTDLVQAGELLDRISGACRNSQLFSQKNSDLDTERVQAICGIYEECSDAKAYAGVINRGDSDKAYHGPFLDLVNAIFKHFDEIPPSGETIKKHVGPPS